MISTLKTAANRLKTARLIARGWREFERSGQTPDFAYQALIHLHCQTQGRSNDWIHARIARRHPPLRLEKPAGILGELDETAQKQAGAALEQDGVYIFPQRLSSEMCDQLEAFARRTPAQPFPPAAGVPISALFDVQNPLGSTYKFSEAQLLGENRIQDLALDPSLLTVAQNYLGCAPILDLVAMWWSAPQQGENSSLASQHARSETAQLYHFDMDRVKWLKFFIYLTDVTPETGPHIFVRGSHRAGNQPRELLSKGYARLSDEEIARFYGQESIMEITGPRGTIVAEDTRGFHKGKPPVAGERLILQVEFCDSLFGGGFNRTPLTPGASWQRAMENSPRLVSKFSVEAAP